MLYRNFTTREKVLLLLLAVLLIALTYFLLIQTPVSNELTELRAEESMLQSEVTVAQARQAQMQRMQNELDAGGEGLAAPVPDYDNLQNVMTFLNETLAGTTTYDATFAPVDTTEQFVRRSVNLQFASPSYTAAATVVRALSAAPFRVQLSNMSFIAEDSGVTTTVTVTFFESQSNMLLTNTEEETDAAA